MSRLPQRFSLIYLHKRGLRVPADVGVVSIEFDWFLRDLAFSLAHYEISLERMVGRLARLAVRLATTGTLPGRQTLLMPRFVPGDSLVPLATCPRL